MTIVSMIKGAVGLAATIGTEQIVANVVKTTTPATVGKLSKVCIKVSSCVLGLMGGKVVADFAGEQMDNVERMIQAAKQESEKEEVAE